MNYLFLDYDDTLNLPTGDDNNIDKIPLINLQYLITEYNPKIIISASMKIHGFEYVQQVFNQYDINIHDITPNLRIEISDKFHIPRGLEIEQWFIRNSVPFMPYYLSNNMRVFKPNANYCIVDDDADMLLNQKDNFVHVDPEHGGLNHEATKDIEKCFVKP